MKIHVENLLGDAAVFIYNKQGEMIHREEFFGKTDSSYIREIPVDPLEFGHSTSLSDNNFKYTIR